jgi:hypothetical protein
VKNDLDHLCDQLGMLGLLAECAASGCRGLGGLRVSRSLRVIFALMGRYPRCGRRDTAPVASRYDQERRPKIRVIVTFFLISFLGWRSQAPSSESKRASKWAISFVRMTIMRDRSKVLYPGQLSNNVQHRMPAGAG